MSNTELTTHMAAAGDGAIASLIVLAVAGILAASPAMSSIPPDKTHEIRSAAIAIAATGAAIAIANTATLMSALLAMT